jgi:hypothetical protein
MSYTDLLTKIRDGLIVTLKTQPRSAAELNGARGVIEAIFSKEKSLHTNIEASAIEGLCSRIGLKIIKDGGNGSKRTIVAPPGWGGNQYAETVMPFHAPHGATAKLPEEDIKSLGLLLVHFGVIDAALAQEWELQRFAEFVAALAQNNVATNLDSARPVAVRDDDRRLIEVGTMLPPSIVARIKNSEKQKKYLAALSYYAAGVLLAPNPEGLKAAMQSIFTACGMATADKNAVIAELNADGLDSGQRLLLLLRLAALADTTELIATQIRDRNLTVTGGDTINAWFAQGARSEYTFSKIQSDLRRNLPAETARTPEWIASLEAELAAKIQFLEAAGRPVQRAVLPLATNGTGVFLPPQLHGIAAGDDTVRFEPKSTIRYDWAQLPPPGPKECDWRQKYVMYVQNESQESPEIPITNVMTAASGKLPQSALITHLCNPVARRDIARNLAVIARLVVAKNREKLTVNISSANGTRPAMPLALEQHMILLYSLAAQRPNKSAAKVDFETRLIQPIPQDIPPDLIVSTIGNLVDPIEKTGRKKIARRSAPNEKDPLAEYFNRQLSQLVETYPISGVDAKNCRFTTGHLGENPPLGDWRLLARQPYVYAIYAPVGWIRDDFAKNGIKFDGFDPHPSTDQIALHKHFVESAPYHVLTIMNQMDSLRARLHTT